MKLAPAHNCTGCMACVDTCGRNALTVEIDKNGYFNIAIDKNKCVDCGACAKTCPILHTDKIRQKGSDVSYPFAAWNTDSEIREVSASGGAFSALATNIIKNSGVVYGAVLDGFSVKHKRATTLEELIAMFGSKYQHSDMRGCYRQVLCDLKAGKTVLFSGMACQVAGLMQFLGNIDTSNLYTVDTICGGISTMLPMIQLSASGFYTGIQSFRDKENGWKSRGFKYSLKMACNDGGVENLGLDNLVLNTFSSKLLKRSSCLDCHFTGNDRYSDCTIGDFWGDVRFKEEHDNGVSVMVLHNDRMHNLLESSSIKLTPIRWSDFIPFNYNYIWTKYPLIRHFISRRFALFAMRNGFTRIALHLMRPKTISGLVMSAYLKINNIFRDRHYRVFLDNGK